MKLLKYFIFLLFLSTLNGAISAQTSSDYQVCRACHGELAEGNKALLAPALAGLEAAYLERQLNHFKNGIRGQIESDTSGAQMAAIAMSLSEQQMAAMAKEISMMPAVKPGVADGGDIAKGKKYFTSNCAACHSNLAEGNEQFSAPALNFQEPQYLLRQLRNFRNGLRGVHAQDKYGKQMTMMAKTLPDDAAVEDVVAYISTL